MRRMPVSGFNCPEWKCFLALVLYGTLIPSAVAQAPLQDSALPAPRLTTIMPMGAKVGTTIELTFTGTDLEDPQELRFSTPSIKADPIMPPPPPPPDPKKPVPAPPKAPITKFKVTLAPDTPLGLHDVRLVNKWGISNPRVFVVGDLNEVLEKEPNNDVKEAQRVELNTVINGNMAGPTDVDYFIFTAKKDQKLVINCLTYSIDSRMHAQVEAYDSQGRRLASNRFYNQGDAVMDFIVPADGDYIVRLSAFTYAEGNAEHFYRLTIGTIPWIDAVYPPMVEPGKTTKVTILGRNLPGGQLDPAEKLEHSTLEKLVIDLAAPQVIPGLIPYSGHLSPTTSALDGFEYRLKNAAGASNPMFIAFARAPVVFDSGAHDTPETAQVVTVPCEIAGRVQKKRDRDWYAFTAKKGEVYTIECYSERLGYPADMYYLLRNGASKQVITEQDDNPDNFSLKCFTRTHDPAPFRFVVPADGQYQLLVSSTTADNQFGPRDIYRARITPEIPDFQILAMPTNNHRPDGNAVLQGGSESFTILAWRLEGFDGEINLVVEGLPKGVTCPPQILGKNMRQTELVISAAPDASVFTGPIKIKGTAVVKGVTVTKEARPATITWPVQPQAQIPTLTRLDRQLVLAVREKAPYNLTTALDKPVLQQGEKANLTVKLARLWPDFKAPLQVMALAVDLPQNLTINNNQPMNVAEKNEATLVVDAKSNLLPGNYSIVLRTQVQTPYNKDPMAKQKQPVQIVLPSTPVNLTVLPKMVGTVTLAAPNAPIKVGAQAEITVKLARLFDYAGEFKLELVIPQGVQGIAADPVSIPAGKDEAKLIVKVAANAPIGQRGDYIVRAVAPLRDKFTATQEAKLTLNVTK